jgi:hypothetical protein
MGAVLLTGLIHHANIGHVGLHKEPISQKHTVVYDQSDIGK